jgi:AraC-like DNA-binding protein
MAERNEVRKKYAAEKVQRGLEIIRQGGTYREAAKVAGYTDEAGFSRACLNAFGARPLAIVQREAQERAA